MTSPLLLRASFLVSSVLVGACDVSHAPVPAVGSPAAPNPAPATTSAHLGSAAGMPSGATPTSATAATALDSIAMNPSANIEPSSPLPLSIEVRGPAQLERTTDLHWRVRVNAHVVNHFESAAISERGIFHATAYGEALALDAAESTFPEMTPLAPDQSVDGTVTFDVPRGMRAPTRIDLAYGMRGEQVALDVPVD